MPRAADPSLFGNQIPINYDPLSRIEYQVIKPDFDIDAMLESLTTFVVDFLFPVIEDLTGLDLSAFAAAVEGLDFSSPDAFLMSLAQALIGIAGAIIPTVSALVEAITGVLDGDLNDLVAFFGGFAGGASILTQLVTALTGSSGGLLDLSDFFNLGGAGSILGAIQTPIQQLIDTVFNGITGAGRIDNLLEDVIDALQNIPFLNVIGVGGPANIGSALQETWDQLIGGFVGTVGIGAGLADLFNIGQDISSRATLGQFSWDILGIRSNKSLNTGLLPTSESNIGLDKVALATSAPTFGVTQSTAITAFQRISEAASKGVVSWLGSGVTNITSAFVNIFQMDPATGDMTLVHASPDIIGNLSATMQYNLYEIPTPLEVQPGEIYGIEIAVRGTGTHNVAGASTWLPDHPGVFPRRLSAVRNSGTSAPPSTIATGSVAYTSNVPFVEFGVSAGDVSIPRSPETTLFSTPGSNSIPIPSWTNFVEVIALGSGGGGRQGGTWGISGEGGENGEWATATWTRGTEFTGSPSITVTVGARGSGGSGIGGNGGNAVVSITGHTVTATGGEGGDALNAGGGDKDGRSPGTLLYGGVTYVGGGTQYSFGGNGAVPGGGGAGGNWVSFQPGGHGAAGAVWIRFRQ